MVCCSFLCDARSHIAAVTSEVIFWVKRQEDGERGKRALAMAAFPWAKVSFSATSHDPTGADGDGGGEDDDGGGWRSHLCCQRQMRGAVRVGISSQKTPLEGLQDHLKSCAGH